MKASCKLVNRIKGTNITADTVEGLGRIKKIWGTESGLGTDINLFDGKIEQGSWMTDTGELVDSLKRVRSVNYIAVNGNTKYTFSIKDSDIYQILVAQYNSSKGFISSDQTWNNFDYTITTANNAAYIKILIQYKSNTDINANNITGIKMQKGTVATKWSPYNHGSIEIVSKNGEQQSSNMFYVSIPIAKDDVLDFSKQQVKRTVTYSNSEEEVWAMGTSSVYNRQYFYTGTNIALDVKPNSTIENTVFKLRDEVKDFSTENWIALASNGCPCIYLKEITTLEQFKTWLAQNPLTVTYERNVELLNCSDKIIQYANSTTVYNTDGAEIEVSLTNNKAISEVNENINELEKKQETIKTKIWAMNANTQKTIVNIPGLKKIINVYCMDESVTTYPNREIIAFKQDGENVTVVQKGTIQYTNYFTIVYV